MNPDSSTKHDDNNEELPAVAPSSYGAIPVSPGNDDNMQPSSLPPSQPIDNDADADIPSTHTQHLNAEDLDLIEKEWVVKAKQIVDRTQGDPYTQNQELNKIKADYIKKRYNRTIKSNE